MEQKKRANPYLFIFYFSMSVLYLEILFRLATVGNLFNMGLIYTLFLSIGYGMLGYLLSSIFKNRKTNRIIGLVLLVVTTVVYEVQYLIYKQFKQFYDINTMTGGAGDALTSYYKELLSLIFEQGGIIIMILMFVPAVLFWIFSKNWMRTRVSNLKVRVLSASIAALSYVLSLILIMANPIYSLVFDEQYNFQSAVSSFGLITGLGLDVKQQLFGEEYEFEQPDIPTLPPAPSTDGSETTTQPIEYGYNIMDIDFDALNKKASSEQKKLNNYVSGLTASKQNAYTGLFKGKNLIMISAEAFSAELIDPVLTPTLYRLATKGIQFTDYYQPASAGTTGGEYQNIFGMLPTAGGKSFKNTADHLNYFTIGAQLNRLGYYGKAFHNNSYTYYDRNKTHNNLGYSDGFMGYGNGMEQYVTKRWPQSDLEMFSGTLPTYIDKQPFNVYYMTVSGHSNYTKTGNSMTKRHWDRVQDLPYSDLVKGYFAANLDFEDALAHLVAELEKAGIADDTVICISTDHFPYGLDSGGKLGNFPYLSELYGYNVENYFQRDHSRLILWCGSLEDDEPIVVSSPTFSLDILPTLSNLFGTEFDSRLMVGRDVFSDAMPLVFNTNYDWKTDLGTYYASSGKFVPVSEDTVIPEGYVAAVKAIVKNKRNYCSGALNTDYFRLLFG
ncbi:MAG: sulfatase-like hydrolase/transferase [Oscillospiraceae bacterium]|nr:sulfatase-like hydrolase/transferase [Oscillospiraceae bacterium]